MTDREKLIELLNTALGDADITRYEMLLVADYLCDNGVTMYKTGLWIPSESDFDDNDTLFDVEEWCDWQCSACYNDICYEDPMERRWLPKFCPNCGAKMEVDYE